MKTKTKLLKRTSWHLRYLRRTTYPPTFRVGPTLFEPRSSWTIRTWSLRISVDTLTSETRVYKLFVDNTRVVTDHDPYISILFSVSGTEVPQMIEFPSVRKVLTKFIYFYSTIDPVFTNSRTDLGPVGLDESLQVVPPEETVCLSLRL